MPGTVLSLYVNDQLFISFLALCKRGTNPAIDAGGGERSRLRVTVYLAQ